MMTPAEAVEATPTSLRVPSGAEVLAALADAGFSVLGTDGAIERVESELRDKGVLTCTDMTALTAEDWACVLYDGTGLWCDACLARADLAERIVDALLRATNV